MAHGAPQLCSPSVSYFYSLEIFSRRVITSYYLLKARRRHPSTLLVTMEFKICDWRPSSSRINKKQRPNIWPPIHAPVATRQVFYSQVSTAWRNTSRPKWPSLTCVTSRVNRKSKNVKKKWKMKVNGAKLYQTITHHPSLIYQVVFSLLPKHVFAQTYI